MNMQEPEEQRLEDEQMEPTEDIVEESSDESVLNDAAASESDEEPASITESVDETEQVSVEEEQEEEPLLDFPSDEEVGAGLNEDPVPDIPTAEDVDTILAEEDAELSPAPEDDSAAWFVIHCYSGYENKVRHNLEQRIETMGMKDMIFDVVVPTQEEIEVRDGKRRTVAGNSTF